MTMDMETYLNSVLEGYKSSYDIVSDIDIEDLPLKATAELHANEAGYVLIRKAQMWSASSDEYVYFFAKKGFDEKTARDCIEYAYKEGESKVDVETQKDHMCTRITVVLISEHSDDSVRQFVKKEHLYKTIKMSLNGWIEGAAVLVELNDDMVTSHRYGKETADFLNGIINPQARKKKHHIWGIIKEMLQ